MSQYCFKEVFLIISLFDWPFRICLCRFVDRFTSFVETLLIFTKKRFFEWWEADLLSVSILSDLMLLEIGVRKRAVHEECWSLILRIKCRTLLILVDLLMVISHLVKVKRDDYYIYLCSKQSIGKYLNQNLTVSAICICLSVYLLPKSVNLSVYAKRLAGI